MALSDTWDFTTAPAVPRSDAWRQVGLFYLLTTALSLAVWIPFAAQLDGLLPGHIPAWLVVASQYSPTAVALALVAREGGLAGLAAFLRRSLRLGVGVRWFAVALLTPLLMGLGLLLLHAAEGAYVPTLASLPAVQSHLAHAFVDLKDASGGASNAFGNLLARWASPGLLQALLIYCGVCFANGGLSEEAGWRGYALSRLLPGRRAIVAVLIIGFFWGVWHTGPAFWAGVFQSNWRVLAIPLEYTLGTIPLTVMIAWVFLGAKQSLLPGMVFHACYNGTFFFLTQIWTPGRPVVSILEWLAASYVAAAIVAVVGRRMLFARQA